MRRARFVTWTAVPLSLLVVSCQESTTDPSAPLVVDDLFGDPFASGYLEYLGECAPERPAAVDDARTFAFFELNDGVLWNASLGDTCGDPPTGLPTRIAVLDDSPSLLSNFVGEFVVLFGNPSDGGRLEPAFATTGAPVGDCEYTDGTAIAVGRGGTGSSPASIVQVSDEYCELEDRTGRLCWAGAQIESVMSQRTGVSASGG